MKKKRVFWTVFPANQFCFPYEIRKIGIPVHSKLPKMLFHTAKEMKVPLFHYFFRKVKQGIQAVASELNNMAP